MKKFLSILMVLAMILAMSTTAFAAENTNVTITNANGTTYEGYKILNLSTSLRTGEHHIDHDGAHNDDCFNYAYTIASDNYRKILQKETFENAGASLWGSSKPATAEGVTDAQILDHLSKQSSDNGDQYGTMRSVADRIYRAIKEWNNDPVNATNKIVADVTIVDGNSDNIEQGYWIFADVTDLDGANDNANSLVLVDTKGQDALTIKPKTSIPSVEKKVKDIDDSEDANFGDNPWQDTADHDIGDSIPFKLTATLPSNVHLYDSYELIFHDTLSEGLTLNVTSIKVLMYETKHKADVDLDVNDGTELTLGTDYQINTTGVADGCSFEVVLTDAKDIANVTSTSAFVVYYEAELNNDAKIGAEGNPNEVYLEFSNNPYGEGSGKTGPDKVTVFTYQLIVNKIDAHGHELKGAGFTLYKKDVNGTYNAIGTELTGADMTKFVWNGLDDGDYKLSETTVPAGYNKMADVLFSISAEHVENAGAFELISLDGGLMGMGEKADGKFTGKIIKEIVNHTGTVLPETGAQGTFLFICGGSLLAILAAVFMITRKKMSVFED